MSMSFFTELPSMDQQEIDLEIGVDTGELLRKQVSLWRWKHNIVYSSGPSSWVTKRARVQEQGQEGQGQGQGQTGWGGRTGKARKGWEASENNNTGMLQEGIQPAPAGAPLPLLSLSFRTSRGRERRTCPNTHVDP